MLRGPPGVVVGLQGGSGVLSVTPLPTLAVCKGQAYAASSRMESLSKWKGSDPMRWFICLRCRLAGPLCIMPEAVHCWAAHPFIAASCMLSALMPQITHVCLLCAQLHFSCMISIMPEAVHCWAAHPFHCCLQHAVCTRATDYTCLSVMCTVANPSVISIMLEVVHSFE